MSIGKIVALTVSIVVLVISFALVKAPAILVILSVCAVIATKYLLIDRLVRLREDEFVAYVLPFSLTIRTVSGPRNWYAPPMSTFYKFGTTRGIGDCVQKSNGTFSFTHVSEKDAHHSVKSIVTYTVTDLAKYSMLRVDMMGETHDCVCHGRMEHLESDMGELLGASVRIRVIVMREYTDLFPTCQVCTERLYDSDLVSAVSKLVTSFKKKGISDEAACKMSNAVISYKLHNNKWPTW